MSTGACVPADSRITPVASPLRWAGGKRWLLPTIKDLLEDVSFETYHEPFLGGASVFLGLTLSSHANLSDSNNELISVFQAIRDFPDEVADATAKFANDKTTYYAVRSSRPRTAVNMAARFLFLNHTSFNGIYRVNLKGVYNVPFGFRPSANIPDKDHLQSVSARLKGVDLRTEDFAKCIDRVGKGDLIFLDPPYTVAHNNNGFIKYNQKLFSFEDQKRLSKLIDQIRSRDAYYILANAAHDSILKLFDKGDCRLDTSRRNSIGGKNAVRGSAAEYLFTNLGQKK